MGKLGEMAGVWCAPVAFRARLRELGARGRVLARRVWDGLWLGFRPPAITAADYQSAVHVLPAYEVGKHVCAKPCPCLPRLEDYRPRGGRLLVIHRESN